MKNTKEKETIKSPIGYAKNKNERSVKHPMALEVVSQWQHGEGDDAQGPFEGGPSERFRLRKGFLAGVIVSVSTDEIRPGKALDYLEVSSITITCSQAEELIAEVRHALEEIKKWAA